MIIRIALIFATLTLANNAIGQWVSDHSIDPFDKVETHRAYGFGTKIDDEYTSFGIRCDNRNKLLITTGFATDLDTPNAYIDLAFKVDGYEPIFLQGRLYMNSVKSAFVRMNQSNKVLLNRLIDQSLKGNVVSIRASNKEQTTFVDYEVPLIGFTRHSASTRVSCGIGYEKVDMLAEDKAELKRLNLLLDSIKEKIAAIEGKY
ncbi:hypothetical protein LNL84_05755 [Vibrio sp. ZSDZ34]|uniref:Uncharacterized protein n=1 Tax=Vibrio gelatinilyticus TaxID=2893468 RepID=A0A9X1W8I8_9VIBR|nr:hypothetical protein [Vibrio gelatinilyticus]MCJ2376337.1 hypothetical protein [Vibrio gelatinilyticus]